MIELLAGGTLVAVLVSPLAALASGGRPWRAGADVDVSAVREPYARVRLPIAVDPTPEGDYHDLRVIDDRGSEVPYVVDPRKPELPNAELPMSDRGFTAGRGPQAVFDLGGDGTLHDALDLRIGRETYFTRVAVDASDDVRTWRTLREDALVYHVANQEGGDARVSFAPTRARWIRVRIRDGRAAFPLEGAALARAATAAPALVQIGRSGNGERPAGAPRTQRYTVDLRVANAAVAAVRIDATTASFERAVWIDRSDDGVTWIRVAGDRVTRFEHGAPHLDIGTGNARARRWRVTIDNGDDALLRGVRITLLACPHDLVFPVARGRRYALAFGDAHLDGPAYDLGERLMHEDWRAGLAAIGPVVAVRRAAAAPRSGLSVPGWVPAGAFGGAIVILALFAIRLVRTSPLEDDGVR